jgi:hypothetical protein
MAVLFESQKRTARNVCLSINSQASSNDLFADNKFTQRQRFDGTSVWERIPSRRSDKDQAGKGTEFATEGQETLWDTKGELKGMEAEGFTLGWMFAFAWGTDTVTGSGPYVHDFTIEETTTKAMMTNVYVEDTAAIKTKYQDMAITEFTMSYAQKSAIKIDIMMAGCGHWTDGAIASLPAVAQPTYLLNSDTTVTLGPVGSGAVISSRVRSGSVKFSTGAVSHTGPGNGLYGYGMRLGLRKISFDLVIAAQSTDDILTLIENDTLSFLDLSTNSGAAAEMDVNFPAFKLKAVQIGAEENMIIWKISADETCMYNIGGAGVATASVTNSVAAYLTAV